ncbi:unnamed protein product [Rotaria socialis]|uniref:VCBS repeat-containing protein n=1 Tax=Rotaria socialis TaxID=392032 RepID=A0A818Z1S8_9BILA|nr:unnamed protein product [Rotaria socialis]CAF4629053.1 unnamed protein product [Rotaria socialis]
MVRNDVTVNLGDLARSCFCKGCRDTFKSLARTSISYDSRSKSVIIVDLNNDTQPDFVVANSGTDNIRVFYRYPIGTFDNQKIYAVATACQAYAVVAGDFNRDKRVDIMVACHSANNLVLLLA